ncbi:hypothetical protein DNU06_03075 [Putridiphycobacter roseus]|uniref:Uncharacterized protein n=1 Tax=Putridiphycobacter roseus TaxID=2219161 RepID=A0A2W1NVK4_9FLAO|nr:AAA domain-containing protein [Putridiphycobacter roseus]PZE18828.1 hypothetical protein DNU06_03075 [Putridiphycobacter roseus]
MSNQDKHSVQDRLSQLQEALFDISSKNPFLQIKENRLVYRSLSVDVGAKRLEKIYQKQQHYLKEYGLETSLKIGLFLQWKMPNKKEFYTSPLCYVPIQIKKDQKIALHYKIVEEVGGFWEVNPILKSVFKKVFEVDLKTSYETKEELIEFLQEKFDNDNQQLGRTNTLDVVPASWRIVEKEGIGTFNYKKSLLGQDYEEIIQSPNQTVAKLLGYGNNAVSDVSVGEVDLSYYPLDYSQKKIIQSAHREDVIIQGPPGTGKSHSIAILIQSFLNEGKSVLFVSEKKSALSIVHEKLKPLQTLIAYFDASVQQKKEFYKKLKVSLEKLVLPLEKNEVNQFVEIETLKFQAYHYPKAILSNNPQTDCSLWELEQYLVAHTKIEVDINPKSVFPHFGTWSSLYEELIEIERQIGLHFSSTNLGDMVVLNLNLNVLNEVAPWKKIKDRIEEAKSILIEFNTLQKQYDLNEDFDTFSKYCMTASVLNMVNKNWIDVLIEDAKEYVVFDKLSKRYEKTQQQYQQAKAKNELWNKLPNFAEVENVQTLLNVTGFFGRLKNKKAITRFFKSFEGIHTSENQTFIIDAVIKELKLKDQLDTLQLKLKHELGIINPDQEISFILNVRSRLANLNHSLYEDILSRENATEFIEDFSFLHTKLDRFNQINRYLFRKTPTDKLNDFVAFADSFLKNLVPFQLLENELKLLLSSPNRLLDFLQLNARPLTHLNEQVYFHYWNLLQKTGVANGLSSGDALQKRLRKFNTAKKVVIKAAQKKLWIKYHQKWKAFEALDQTPNQKLSEENKELKYKFRQAKRLLIHEANKKQQHLPIKQLFEKSQFILTQIKPVWMMNPLAISERLPLEKDLFDVVIFDESSQIPIEDAIPALYRAKKAIVVGDDKQMPPNRFFASNNNSMSLLNAVQTFLPTASLMWHYRSQHPALIQFSNEQFYEHSLKMLPPFQQEYPIEFVHVPEGEFVDGKNNQEARLIVAKLDKLLKAGHFDIGIIAFSKEQELNIRKTIHQLQIDLPEGVLISNLENIQGIEKEFILISVGYAKNKNGVFIHNFGPINHKSGENRLNVLFTRAIQQMIIFSSVLHTDFKLSDNKGVMVLKDFLYYAESKKFDTSDVPKHGFTLLLDQFFKQNQRLLTFVEESEQLLITCFIDYKSSRILLVNPGLHNHQELELSIILELLYSRFEKVKILLHADWIQNKEKVKLELLDFFK